MKVRLIFAVFAIIYCVDVPALTAEEFFPFVAQSIANRVNVRAGQSQNFERLCMLESGEEVLVLDKNFGWYKIQLPLRTHLYVSDKYVHPLSDLEGEITADRVNVRAKASIESSIISQLEKGARVRIVAKKEGWYTIQPSEQASGWVAESLLKFKSEDVSTYHLRQDNLMAQAQEASVPIVSVTPQAPPATAVASPNEQSKIISALGYLKPCTPSPDRGLSYKLVTVKPRSAQQSSESTDRPSQVSAPVYYIRGLKSILRDFVGYVVTIDGTLDAQVGTQSQQPVIFISKIQLVL